MADWNSDQAVAQPGRFNAAAEDPAKAAGSATRAGLTSDSRLRRCLALCDAMMVIAALTVSLELGDHPKSGDEFLLASFGVPLMIVMFKLYGLYDRDVKRMSHSTVDDLPWLFHAVVLGVLLFWLYSKVTPLHRLDFVQVCLLGATMMVGVPAARWLVRSGLARWSSPESAVLVGGGPMATALVNKLRAHTEYRSRLVGTLGSSGEGVPVAGLPRIGSATDLDAVVSRYGVARVIIAADDVDQGELEELLRQCRKLSLKVSLLPQLSDVLGPAVEVDDVAGVAVLGVNPPWLPRSSAALKRSLDLLVASSLLVLASPVLLIIAAAVKLDSSGPLFFRQTRVGRGGKPFTILKFRTMVADAEQRRAELVSQSKDPDWLLLESDPRVTRSGHLLRLSSLDELPQLWNVLRGQMSMVGPRPLIPLEDERVQSWARGRLDLTPGITGYWQVLGRTRIPFEEMVKLDYLYVMSWSLWEDIRLMLRTLPVLLSRKGAN